MTRVREMVFRVGNGLLLRAAGALQRACRVDTVYEVGPHGAAALFEGQRFDYSYRHFGCTGNLDWMGQAENETRTVLFSEARPGDVLYDIGAHGGVYSLTWLARCGGEVHSFEPQPDELLRNFALNGRSTEHVHAVALGDEAGSARLTTRHRSGNPAMPGARGAASSHAIDAVAGTCEVPLVRLDDYADALGLPDPQWIKIDVEGMELPALRGAQRVLERARPVVVCEISHLHDRFGSALSALLDQMAACGYGLWRLQQGRLLAVARASTREELGSSADDNYWFVPRGRLLEALRTV